MDIAPLAVHDAVDVVDLLDVLGYPSTQDQARRRLTRMLAHPDYAAWGARTDVLVGLAAGQLNWMLQADEPVSELVVLAVLPDRSGQGAGSLLLQEFERWSIEKGCRRLKVTSGSHRARAHEFYQRRGYERSGVRFHKTVP